jgi:hypothetical protein
MRVGKAAMRVCDESAGEDLLSDQDDIAQCDERKSSR